MKLIEKLADEWCEKHITHGEITTPFLAYMEGFRKARDMARDLNGGWGLEKYVSSAPGFTNPRHIQIDLALQDLGEEEAQ